MVDFSKGFARHVSARLRREQVIWLTTVDSRNWPQPRPVWFHWDGTTVLMFSQPGTAKIRHIRRNTKVALSLNCDTGGGEVAVILGEAKILRRRPLEVRLKQYMNKYRNGLLELGLNRQSFLEDYSTPILVKPVVLRGF
jgi:PPOX class probable F420-dependent enzyme